MKRHYSNGLNLNECYKRCKKSGVQLSGYIQLLGKKSLDEELLQLAKMTAKILGADNCSIMLFGNTESENSHMQVCASYSLLPAVAYKETIKKGESIAGHVVATGQSLLIEDIKTLSLPVKSDVPTTNVRV